MSYHHIGFSSIDSAVQSLLVSLHLWDWIRCCASAGSLLSARRLVGVLSGILKLGKDFGMSNRTIEAPCYACYVPHPFFVSSTGFKRQPMRVSVSQQATPACLSLTPKANITSSFLVKQENQLTVR
ncbi:hypothetical protein JAAARDRAFT_646342 [Jaapia argillacea MUCL 33604]|uniref:Uncharacterized protein n=1 Tax=Jaapia argillacea MUCL 33604 TaxID=933084 RepID=A0A067PVT2_9AGAM|nr:hypothetical protein JAAARDRAFT_646342 [Jaapia argillacea MUCL 33604]